MNSSAGCHLAATDRQQEVFDWVSSYIRTYGYSPTVDEIRRAFSFKSKNGVMCHLIPLRRKGLLTWVDGKSRTLRAVGVEE